MRRPIAGVQEKVNRDKGQNDVREETPGARTVGIARVKEKVNGSPGPNDVREEILGALTVPQESRAPGVAAHSDPPTDGHAPTDVDRPRLLGILLDVFKTIAGIFQGTDTTTGRMPSPLRPRL